MSEQIIDSATSALDAASKRTHKVAKKVRAAKKPQDKKAGKPNADRANKKWQSSR
jgi:hypothetical protein